MATPEAVSALTTVVPLACSCLWTVEKALQISGDRAPDLDEAVEGEDYRVVAGSATDPVFVIVPNLVMQGRALVVTLHLNLTIAQTRSDPITFGPFWFSLPDFDLRPLSGLPTATEVLRLCSMACGAPAGGVSQGKAVTLPLGQPIPCSVAVPDGLPFTLPASAISATMTATAPVAYSFIWTVQTAPASSDAPSLAGLPRAVEGVDYRVVAGSPTSALFVVLPTPCPTYRNLVVTLTLSITTGSDMWSGQLGSFWFAPTALTNEDPALIDILSKAIQLVPAATTLKPGQVALIGLEPTPTMPQGVLKQVVDVASTTNVTAAIGLGDILTAILGPVAAGLAKALPGPASDAFQGAVSQVSNVIDQALTVPITGSIGNTQCLQTLEALGSQVVGALTRRPDGTLAGTLPIYGFPLPVTLQPPTWYAGPKQGNAKPLTPGLTTFAALLEPKITGFGDVEATTLTNYTVSVTPAFTVANLTVTLPRPLSIDLQQQPIVLPNILALCEAVINANGTSSGEAPQRTAFIGDIPTQHALPRLDQLLGYLADLQSPLGILANAIAAATTISSGDYIGQLPDILRVLTLILQQVAASGTSVTWQTGDREILDSPRPAVSIAAPNADAFNGFSALLRLTGRPDIPLEISSSQDLSGDFNLIYTAPKGNRYYHSIIMNLNTVSGQEPPNVVSYNSGLSYNDVISWYKFD